MAREELLYLILYKFILRVIQIFKRSVTFILKQIVRFFPYCLRKYKIVIRKISSFHFKVSSDLLQQSTDKMLVCIIPVTYLPVVFPAFMFYLRQRKIKQNSNILSSILREIHGDLLPFPQEREGQIFRGSSFRKGLFIIKSGMSQRKKQFFLNLIMLHSLAKSAGFNNSLLSVNLNIKLNFSRRN